MAITYSEDRRMNAKTLVTHLLNYGSLSRLAGMLFSPEEQLDSKKSPDDEAADLRRSKKNLRKLVIAFCHGKELRNSGWQ